MYWNGLPEEVSAPTLNTFKNRLDRCWGTQEIMYNDYRANIESGDVINLSGDEDSESRREEAGADPDLENLARYR